MVKTLLLVDDDPFVRGALTRALNRAGAFAVVPAEHGRHALQLLDTEHVDVMLTDLQMPVMDGLTLLSHLVERGLRLPVAVMTGHSIAPAMRRQLHAYGIAATFTKPVDAKTAASPDVYSINRYYYLYHSQYGSPKTEETPVKVTAVTVSPDRMRVALTVDKLIAGRIYELRPGHIVSADGAQLITRLAAYTLNRLK